MFYRAISLVIVAVLVHGSIAAQNQPQSPPQTVAKMQQVLHKAQEKDKAVKVILNKKIDKQKKFSIAGPDSGQKRKNSTWTNPVYYIQS